MIITSWSVPEVKSAGQAHQEMLVSFDQDRPVRILVIPALFDEANKLRRFTLSVMRALDEAGIDTALPDLPGMNESLALLQNQTLAEWREHAKAAAAHVRATHALTLRGGALLVPDGLPAWRYAPVYGAKLLTTLLRARVVEAREAGHEETRAALLEDGRAKGLILGGWQLGSNMVCELETETGINPVGHETLEPVDFGASALWLRAEPADDADQAKALAGRIVQSLSHSDEPFS
ncbi:MAG: hypothetical protein AAF559_00815 [Pseudomonadota bacterium]